MIGSNQALGGQIKHQLYKLVFCYGRNLCFNTGMLKIQENVILKDFTTFQIGGPAKYFCIVKSVGDCREAFAFAKSRKLPIFVLGGGSNLLVNDKGFAGLIIKNEIRGFKFIDNNDQVILEVGSGEILDEIIALAVMRGLAGLENLSGIPGTVGGAVVQNAGAYGVEVKDSLLTVQGLNVINGKEFSFNNKDCQYGYRDSYFKSNKKYFITSVSFSLNKKGIFNLDYANLKDLLNGGKDVKVAKVREAVLKIRESKLPDWHKLGTAGSYFKNPIISQDKFNKLKTEYTDLPGFPESNKKVKVSLAWLMDKVCDLKGYREGNIGLYEKQPIILVNFGGANGNDVKKFSEKIKKVVKEKINIDIECEVESI